MWVLIRKDLLRRWRSPLTTGVMIVFPLFMSAALGSIFGSAGGGAAFPRITLLVQNEDEGGFLSDALVGSLGSGESQEYLEMIVVDAATDEGRRLMEDGDASALLVLPEGFSEAILAGRPTALEVVRNPAEGIKPEIIAQGARLVATYLDQGARLLSEELGAIERMIEADTMPDAAKVGALAASIIARIDGVDAYLFPPLVSIGSVKEADEPEDDGPGAGGGVFGYILIMTTVMALLFVATRSVGDIHEERNSGILRRQLATPLDLGLVLAAKTVFGVVFGIIVLLILGVIGLALGWITPPRDVPAVLAMGVAFSLAACGLLGLMTSLTRNEKQAGILGWLVIMGMSALGGSMLPVDQMPAAMQAAAPFTVNYWAIDGFTRLIMADEALGDVARHLGILAAMGLATGAAAHVLMIKRFGGRTA